MQQRLLVAADVEVARLAPELEIGSEEGGALQRLAETRKGGGEEQNACDNCRNRQHGEQRRKNTADASLVKLPQGEVALAHLLQNQSCDQIAGDDEEDVHADETAA